VRRKRHGKKRNGRKKIKPVESNNSLDCKRDPWDPKKPIIKGDGVKCNRELDSQARRTNTLQGLLGTNDAQMTSLNEKDVYKTLAQRRREGQQGGKT